MRVGDQVASSGRRGQETITVQGRTALAGALALAGVVVHSYVAGSMVATGGSEQQLSPHVPLDLAGHLLAGGALAVGTVLLGLHWRVGRYLVTTVAVVVLVSATANVSGLTLFDKAWMHETATHALALSQSPGTMILLADALATLLVLYLPATRELLPRIRRATARRANWFT